MVSSHARDPVDMGEGMIVAGLGYRKGVSAVDIESALVAALLRHLPLSRRLERLAAPARKAGEQGLILAAAARGLSIIAVSQAALEEASARALTSSAQSSAVMNVPSVAECAALAAGGATARLLAPRGIVGPVTCALAALESMP
jgi:cobalt-precorrin 5A hydrolase